MAPITIAIIALGALSVFLFVFALMPRVNLADKRLADLERSTVGREADDAFFKKLLDEKSRSNLATKLNAAGWYDVTPTKIVIRTIVSGIVGTVAGIGLVFFIIGDTSWMWLCAGGALVFAGFAAPTVLLNRAAEARQKAIFRAVPDFLDMLTTTVEAGVSLNGALAATVDSISGPLAEELKSALSDIRMGRSRADALTAMAARTGQPDLMTAIMAIVQAERLGGNIVTVLGELAVEARESRMARVEELAAQLPVKMVFPMALFMLPALIVMIFGPVVAGFLSGK
jgi:tight adherence protein C